MTEQAGRARAVWSAGNWDEVSKLVPTAGRVVLDAAGVGPGMAVLDVGCGTGGTVAIPAARGVGDRRRRDARALRARPPPGRGGRGRGRVGRGRRRRPAVRRRSLRPRAVHVRPRLRARPGRRRPRARPRLPPRRDDRRGDVDARGLQRRDVRHARPSPAGAGAGLPAADPLGHGGRWRELVGRQGVELSFRRDDLVFEADDADAFRRDFVANFGPLAVAWRTLGDEAFAALDADLASLIARHNTAGDGALRLNAEYLLAVGSYNP